MLINSTAPTRGGSGKTRGQADEENHLLKENYVDSLRCHGGKSHRVWSTTIEDSETETKPARSAGIADNSD
jgi:hypothetical protein